MKAAILIILCAVASSGLVMAEEEGPVQLESTFVGDKEQPSVSYFIPWQGLGTPDNLYRNIEGNYDQSLQPVDREVLLRSMRMYDEMNLELNHEP
jgi:hypothetical protein